MFLLDLKEYYANCKYHKYSPAINKYFSGGSVLKKNYKLGHLKLISKLSKKNNSLDFHCSVQMERQTVKTLSQKEQSNLGLHSFVGSISPNT